MEIDKKSVLPLYYQLKEILKEEIDIGKYKPGDKIPSENEICQKLNISRNTVQQAVTSLVSEGILFREQGKGTFVAEKKVFNGITEIFSFSDHFNGLSEKFNTKLLFVEEIKESEEALEYLNLKHTIDLYRIQRIREIDDVPIALQTSYIPKHLCPTLIEHDLEKNSLFELLKNNFAADFSHFTETLACIKADKYESEKLKIAEYSPLFLLTRKTYSKKNEIIEFARTYMPGDRCEFYFGNGKDVSIELNNIH